MSGEKIKSSRLFYYSIRFNLLNKCFFNFLHHLFSLIKLLAQLLHFVIVSDDGQAPLRDLHGDAAPGLKSYLFQPVAFKVQAGGL